MRKSKLAFLAFLIFSLALFLSGCGLTNQEPNANFSANPTSGEAPLEVTFNASNSSDSDGSIISYNWDFDDGSTGSGKTTTHTYDSADDYTVELTVTDNGGATARATEIIEVSTGNETDNETGTKVGGILNSDTTWTLDKSPYIVIDDIAIAEGVRLNINPGVEIRFSSNTQMQIEGTLDAEGTESSKILFVPKSGVSGWDGLDFLSTNSQNTSSKIIHCIFRNGGKAIDLKGGENIPEIAHSTFEDGWFGVYSTFGYTTLTLSITDCVIRNNSKGINVRISDNGTLEVSECTITQNDVGVDLAYTSGKANVNGNNIHDNTDYNLMADSTVESGQEIKIDATENWWGTTSISEIEEGIYDCEDDLEYGCVEFEPIATSPQ